MKKIFLALLLLTLVACHRGEVSAEAQPFCGRWMTTDDFGRNHEAYWLKRSMGLRDMRFAGGSLPIINVMPQAQNWDINGDKLVFTYIIHRWLFHLFGKPIIPLPGRTFSLVFTVKMINDSLMVLSSPATRHYPERITTYKHMKLNGHYIVD